MKQSCQCGNEGFSLSGPQELYFPNVNLDHKFLSPVCPLFEPLGIYNELTQILTPVFFLALTHIFQVSYMGQAFLHDVYISSVSSQMQYLYLAECYLLLPKFSGAYCAQ